MADKKAYGGIGVLSCILIGTTGFALSDAMQIIAGDCLDFPKAETIGRVVLILAAAAAACSLLLWMLRGEWMRQRFSGAWLPGTLLGIPIMAIVSILLGVACRINESQAWLDVDLMFRLARMLGAAAMPLTVLVCCLYVAIRRQCNRK